MLANLGAGPPGLVKSLILLRRDCLFPNKIFDFISPEVKVACFIPNPVDANTVCWLIWQPGRDCFAIPNPVDANTVCWLIWQPGRDCFAIPNPVLTLPTHKPLHSLPITPFGYG